MLSRDATLAQFDDRFSADGINYLLVQFVDLHGTARVKLVPANTLRSVVEVGAGFAGGAVWGLGQGPHSHDMFARIDLDSYTPLPYEPGVARFAADLYVDDQPYPNCPRVFLRNMLGRARDLGYQLNVGIEPEFFLVVRDEQGSIAVWDPRGIDDMRKPCYDYKGISAALGFLRSLCDGLNSLGWGVYQADHEDANGQYEINFRYSDALTTADRHTFFRMMAGQLAQRQGAIATFMAKPFADRTGSGAHLHYHLADVATGNNLFLEESDPRGLGLSRLAYHFMGGVFAHVRAICAVLSPTVNCYKRLQAGTALTGSRSGYTWTPAFISYGDNNRTQMMRIPEGGHIEDRSPSSACNPYLAIGVYLAAGLDGIARGLDPGEPTRGNLYSSEIPSSPRRGDDLLPQSLLESLNHLEADAVIREALGPIADEFLRLKHEEWREYHAQVGPWETGRYLTVL